jgi:membrane-associated PAP2 superfamily phosphatase
VIDARALEALPAGRDRWSGLVLPVLALAAALLSSQTDWDMDLQRWFYIQGSGWLVDAKAPLPRLLFYDGPKIALGIAGGAMIALIVTGYLTRRFRPVRRELVFLVLCMALVPTIISNLKSVTDVYCPSQIVDFGGRYVHVPPFRHHPEAMRQAGHCFPAGHASGGYALLALGFVDRRRARRMAGIATGLGVGTVMAVYQMAKGAHFLSHSLTTIALAWLLVAGLAALMDLPRQGASHAS